ncbi:hypothetical protein [Niabella aurantiaca]|uniref:hypothetical protein n=1 Tax=Niabella aurantiaca TaxID=379900 RepID=UPI0012FAC2E0|nr:hypothetical protein [Niabella aurantiaca]
MSKSTAALKMWYRSNPVEAAAAISKLNAMDAAYRFDSLRFLKERFEGKYGTISDLKGDDRWLFIALAFKVFYPQAYKSDDKALKFVGFGERMCELLHMQPPNFSDAFKAVRLNLTTKDSDLRKLADEVFFKLGYTEPCQQTLFDL